MQQEILQKNLRRRMKEKKFSMLSLSIAAMLNETAVRDILNGKVKSPTYKTLFNLASVLDCKVSDLVDEPDLENLQLEGFDMLFANPKIDLKRFAKVIELVDQSLSDKKRNISALERAKIYFALYDHSLIDQHGNIDS